MADNKRWFKVWSSISSDPDFDDLPNDIIGVWVKLGALIAKHGISGTVEVSKNQFFKRLNMEENKFDFLQKNLAKINVKITDSCNGSIAVTFNKWSKYQVDSTSLERVKRWRKQQFGNGACNDKKKKKKKNKEEDKEKDKEKDNKNIYGSFVFLTDEEHKKLVDRFGEVDALKRIEKLDNYMGSKGKQYKSHYHTILNWAGKEDKKSYEL